MQPVHNNLWFGWLSVGGLCAVIFFQSCFATPDVVPTFAFNDKLLHMAAYGVLAALFFRACRLTWPERFLPVFLLTISILFATLYGVSDEIHQSFVKARQAEVGDVIADFLGSILGAAGYLIIHQTRRGDEIRSHQKRDRHAQPPAGDGTGTHSQ